MNDLEMKIQEYMIENDISSLTIKQIADNLYVSRPLIYKVIKKMGFNSLEELIEKRNQHLKKNFRHNHNIVDKDLKTVKLLVDKLKNSKTVYVVGLHGTEIVASYLSRQLINLGKQSICITDKYQLLSSLNTINSDDILVTLSNTGLDKGTMCLFQEIKHPKFVITQYQSPMYESSEFRIGVNTDISTVSNRFERESIVELMIVVQFILIEYRNLLLIKVNYDEEE